MNDRRATEYEWLAAHVYNLHNPTATRWSDPCECDFCCSYREEHGPDVDPWVGPWSELTVVMR